MRVYVTKAVGCLPQFWAMKGLLSVWICLTKVFGFPQKVRKQGESNRGAVEEGAKGWWTLWEKAHGRMVEVWEECGSVWWWWEVGGLPVWGEGERKGVGGWVGGREAARHRKY